MPLPTPPSDGPGGILHLEYFNADAGERHSIHMHLCQFDQAPTGPTNDHAYTGIGPVAPSGESLVSETYAALAALWSAYYDASWVLRCVGLYFNAAGKETWLTPVPDFPTHAGSNTTDDLSLPRFDRRFRLLSRRSQVRHLHLAQIPGTQHLPAPFNVSATDGGLDARDRAIVAYLSGLSGGGAVMPDGAYAFPQTTMLTWWARSLVAGWISAPGAGATPGAPYVVTG